MMGAQKIETELLAALVSFTGISNTVLVIVYEIMQTFYFRIREIA